MAGKTIAPKSAAITAGTATGYLTVGSTTGWYKGAKGSLTRQAQGLLTFTGVGLDTETVTIGAKVYTFQTVLTNVDGHVLLGANQAASIANLIAAINLAAGAGATYAAATTANAAGVVASQGAGTTMILQASLPGSAGNAIATTETLTNASWGALTLTGGVDNKSIVITEIASATSLGVRIVADDVLGPNASGPNYGRSSMTPYNSAVGGMVYQHEQFIFNPDDLPLS